MAYPDEELLRLYAQWSELAYCAGFIVPRPRFVREFRDWLAHRKPSPLSDGDREMLAEFRRQEEQDGD